MAQPIYPSLPTEGNGHAYCLQQITRIQSELAREAEKRGSLGKKYKRTLNTVEGTEATLATVGAGMGIGGVFLISLVVAIGHEIGSLCCSGLFIVRKVIERRITHKLVKHQRIEAMAQAKLNTISDIVSKALADGDISDIEYKLVLDEVQKFEDLKHKAHFEKMPNENMEELRKKLLEEGHREALAELSKRLTFPSP